MKAEDLIKKQIAVMVVNGDIKELKAALAQGYVLKDKTIFPAEFDHYTYTVYILEK